MLKHIYLILAATFIFGFIIGFVLWIFNNTGEEASSSSEIVNKELSITANEYGGCSSSGCASYRISENGNFTYILRQRNSQDIRREGKMIKEDIKRLKSLVEQTDFDAVAGSQFPGTCPIAYNEQAYRYTIELKNKFHSFDSCKESLHEEQLFKDLNILFKVF